MRRYERPVCGNDSLALILDSVPAGARVLELGTSTGYFSRVLVEARACTVDGVEADPAMAAEAQRWCRTVLVADLDLVALEEHFPRSAYDAVICADVLEHLREPARTLAALPPLLAPGGAIFISIPNIAYAGVLAELLFGEWCYRETGLLDRTHLRFFTCAGVIRLLESAGLYAADLRVVSRRVQETEFEPAFGKLPAALRDYLVTRPDGLSYQYVVTARPVPGEQSEGGARPLVGSSVGVTDPGADSVDELASIMVGAIQRQEAEFKDLRSRLARAEDALATMRRSRSWRLTAPLRRGGDLHRAVRRRCLDPTRPLVSIGRAPVSEPRAVARPGDREAARHPLWRGWLAAPWRAGSWLRRLGPRAVGRWRHRRVAGPVVVFQMGKVGSISVYEALRDAGLPCPVYHAHNLARHDELERYIRATLADPAPSLRKLAADRELGAKIREGSVPHWNVVTMVREPVARSVSAFFQNLQQRVPEVRARYASGLLDIAELRALFLENFTHTGPLHWFETQLEPVFGVDVYARPFTCERGYEIIRAARATVLLVRFEDLPRCAEAAFREAFDVKLRLRAINTAGQKWYGDLYREFVSHLVLPDWFLDEMYGSRLARHFYTEAELAAFRRRWAAAPGSPPATVPGGTAQPPPA